LQAFSEFGNVLDVCTHLILSVSFREFVRLCDGEFFKRNLEAGRPLKE
jgi:hypothetical protein